MNIFSEKNSTYINWTAISPDLEKFRLIVFLGGNHINKYLEIVLDVIGVGLDVQRDPDLRFKMIEILHFLVDEAAREKTNGDNEELIEEGNRNWAVEGVGKKILKDIVNTGLIWRNGGGNSKVRKGVVWFLEKCLKYGLLKNEAIYEVIYFLVNIKD